MLSRTDSASYSNAASSSTVVTAALSADVLLQYVASYADSATLGRLRRFRAGDDALDGRRLPALDAGLDADTPLLTLPRASTDLDDAEFLI